MLKFARNVIVVLILIFVSVMVYDKWQADSLGDGIIYFSNVIQSLYTKIGLP